MSLGELDRVLTAEPDEVAIGSSPGLTRFHERDCARVDDSYQFLPRAYARRHFSAADCCH